MKPEEMKKIEQAAKKEVKAYAVPSDKIREAASFVFINIMNHMDHFPTALGPSSTSSLSDEKEILEAHNLSSNHISCFIYQRTLISVIRHPRTNGKDKVTLILRDETGKYMWNTELNYAPTPFVDPGDDDKLLVADSSAIGQPEKDDKLLLTLTEFLNDYEKKAQHKVLHSCQQAVAKEEQHLKRIQHG